MSKEQDEAKEIIGNIHKKTDKDFWKWLGNTPVGLLVKGLVIFYTGLSFLITSVIGIVVGHTGQLTIPHWIQIVVTLAAVPVLVIAAWVLGRFVIKAAKG